MDNELCADCHIGKNATYATTPHARAWTDLKAGFNLTSCEPCHSTGAGYPEIFPATGFDPATDLPAYLQNVTCQSCHGPGSEHVNASGGKPTIGLVLNSSLCGSCHFSEEGLSGEHHPTYNEWQVSGHNTTTSLPSYVKRPACAKCHEAWNIIKFLETGYSNSTVLRQPGEDAPLTWEIGCTACHDPHDDSIPYQLRFPREEICAKCHNSEGAAPGAAVHHPMAEMRNNTAGYGIDRTNAEWMPSVSCYSCHLSVNPVTGLPNHTFDPNPYACVVCHPDTFPDNDSAQVYIDMIKGVTEGQVTGVELVVDEARDAIAQMKGNRTGENLATWMNEYNISSFNLETISADNSAGNHNPVLATRLLDDAMERAQEILANLTPPDRVVGVQVTRMNDGSIVVNWSSSGATDFVKYRVYVLTTAKSDVTSDTWKTEVTNRSTLTTTVTGLDKDTVYYVIVTAVDADGNEITNGVAPVSVGKVAVAPEPQPAEDEGLSTLDYGLIGLVVVLAVIAALLGMMMMRKGKGEKPSETPVKTEE